MRSTKQYCLDRNGIYITKFRTRRNSGLGIGNYYISDILHAKYEQIFGPENVPDINSIVIELNRNQISRFNKEHVISILRESDLFHIKLSAPNGTNLRDIYRVERDETEVARAFTGIYDFERSYSSLIHAPLKSLIVRWDIQNPCPHCGCVLFFTEDKANIRKKCCNNGKIFEHQSQYPALRPLPAALLHYCVHRKNHMGRNSVSYNQVLALGATGADNDSNHGGFETIHGNHSFLLHGRMYHCLPDHNSRTGGLYFFTYDAIQQMQEYGDRCLNKRDESGQIKHYRFYKDIAASIYTELKENNYLVQDCVAIGEHVRQEATLTINLRTSAFDVATIISEESDRPNRVVVFKLKNERSLRSISMTSALVEPLSYPLFFPFGEDGWSTDIAKQVPFYEYLLHRILVPDRCVGGELLMMPTQANPPTLIPVSRFQLMFRLGQMYLVDMVSRNIDYRLQFNRFNQEELFGLSQRDITNNEGTYEENVADFLTSSVDTFDYATANAASQSDVMAKKTFLSQSFHGSRRHLLSLAHNALCLVSEYGRPTLFITLTCNPYWDEIKEMLLEGETAYDRADITCKVFHAKLDSFMHNLRKGKYFGPCHEIVYEVRVIEYQQRGLPHAHLVVQLSNIPDYKRDASNLTKWIDENINATIPPITENSTERLKKIHDLIQSHMIHKCYTGEGGCLNEKTGLCERGFTSTVIQHRTSLDEHGYPHYKHNRIEDLKVVPHNVNILLDWNGHANVEYSGSSYCVIYLYKYLFKGRKKVFANVRKKNRPTNEIDAYVKGRYMCAMDAMWRTYGYQTFPASIPAVNSSSKMLLINS